ncbi:hypothetical protein JTB14_005158 [Gonioctena quinquepunctata]|nr:hypothetical protein JTB14_005158 [Gonioctena quinquepunctata]
MFNVSKKEWEEYLARWRRKNYGINSSKADLSVLMEKVWRDMKEDWKTTKKKKHTPETTVHSSANGSSATASIILDGKEGIFCKKFNILEHSQGENTGDQLAKETPSTSSGEPEESGASTSREPDRSERRTPMLFEKLLLDYKKKQGSRLQNSQR